VSANIRTTGTRAVEAVGAIVAFVSCLDCGAALILDPHDARGVDGEPPINVIEIHREWHERQGGAA
jgi:hypothetical protein